MLTPAKDRHLDGTLQLPGHFKSWERQGCGVFPASYILNVLGPALPPALGLLPLEGGPLQL